MSESKYIFLYLTFSVLLLITIAILGYAWEAPNMNRYIFVPFLILLFVFVGYFLYDKSRSDGTTQQIISKKLYDARETERKKMASELHDGLQQDLHAIGFELKRISKSTFTPKERLEGLTEKINETIDEVRRISYELYPNQLEKLGLKRAIIGMGNDLGDSSDVYFSVKIDDEFEQLLNLEASIQIYRIVQELFNNVVQHSGAKRSDLTMSSDNMFLYIKLTDDGQGFEHNYKKMEVLRKGMGISSIEERLKLMRGKLEIKSQIGKGTEIKIHIPIKNLYNS